MLQIIKWNQKKEICDLYQAESHHANMQGNCVYKEKPLLKPSLDADALISISIKVQNIHYNNIHLPNSKCIFFLDSG